MANQFICLPVTSFYKVARQHVDYVHDVIFSSFPVADPGFSPGGAPTPKSAIIFQFFAENCTKMKEFGPPGGARVPGAPPWIRQCFHFNSALRGSKVEIDVLPEHFLEQIIVGELGKKLHRSEF